MDAKLPVVCAWCGCLQVGDNWKVEDPPTLPVSHGICPECLQLHYPEDAGDTEPLGQGERCEN